MLIAPKFAWIGKTDVHNNPFVPRQGLSTRKGRATIRTCRIARKREVNAMAQPMWHHPSLLIRFFALCAMEERCVRREEL